MEIQLPRNSTADVARELAVMVNTEVIFPLAGTVADEGLKEHSTNPAGKQAKVAFPEKPLSEVTVTLNFAEPPADTVADVGFTAAV